MYSPFPIEEGNDRIHDKLDNGSGLVGHSVFLLYFQYLRTVKEITVRSV